MIRYRVSGRIMTCVDAARVEAGEDPCEALTAAVLNTIATDVEVEAGGITLILAAWMDPDHWAEDWAKVGIDDPHEFIARLDTP